MTFNSSSEADYQHITTGDGSPTLALPPTWEPMHALEGALTETFYIYQPTVQKAFACCEAPTFTSVGLGLAYNELLIAAESVKSNKKIGQLISYEAVDFLTQHFQSWLKSQASPLNSTYEAILELVAQKYELPKVQIQQALVDSLQNQSFKILGRMESAPHFASHGILFDAFSKKTSPELWDELFLEKFFATASQPECYLSTYACSGVLKRSLKKNNFTLNIVKGYAKKKESTFAERIPSV